ncbi:hypothetical protein LTR56_009817 [Elasticomyces elasticus]|nr:hypothetical protein LTR56_009817 [Elasticomyces elasticus]KAK3659132.1 hypothetical protein LTR22_008595 [Elasticomyces elasticus]KAK4923190.1 hypothetical protein LTR49_009658 [Elasticomyces elasticus]
MQHLQRGDIPPPDQPALPHNQTQGQDQGAGGSNWQSSAAVYMLAALLIIVIILFIIAIIVLLLRNGRPAHGFWGRMWRRMTRQTQNAGLGGAAQDTALVPMQAGVPGAVVQGPAQVPGVQNPLLQVPAAQAPAPQSQASRNQIQASNTGATTHSQTTNQVQGMENTGS